MAKRKKQKGGSGTGHNVSSLNGVPVTNSPMVFVPPMPLYNGGNVVLHPAHSWGGHVDPFKDVVTSPSAMENPALYIR